MNCDSVQFGRFVSGWRGRMLALHLAAEQAAYAASYFAGRLSGSPDNAKKQAAA